MGVPSVSPRGTDDPHRRRGEAEPSDPQVQLDFLFLTGNKNGDKATYHNRLGAGGSRSWAECLARWQTKMRWNTCLSLRCASLAGGEILM